MYIQTKIPKKLYIFNLTVYIFVLILYGIDNSFLQTITDKILDIRVSKAIRDITYIVVSAQLISFIMTLIRATGFDLKEFEFKKDLQDLDINTADNEEFEVAVDIDKNSMHRDLRSKLRTVKYFYVEHKFLINALIGILCILIIALAIINKTIYKTYYKEKQSFNVSGYSLNVLNSYLFEGNNDEKIVVVKFAVHKNTTNSQILNTGLMTLSVGNDFYGRSDKFIGNYQDVGELYVNQELSDSFETYILVYTIPEKQTNKKMELKINDNLSYVRGEAGAKNVFVKLNPIDFSKTENTKEGVLGDTIEFSGSVLEDSYLKIEQFEVGQSFKSEYKFCSKKDKCFTSYEYITPSATGQYLKTLLKLKNSFDADDSIGVDETLELFNLYATINYRVDNKWFSHDINSQKIKPKTNEEAGITYIEVNKDVEKADSIYIMFKVHNYNYKYVLK